MRKKKKDKLRMVLLSLAAVIFASAGFVAGPWHVLVKKHKEAQVKEAIRERLQETRNKEYVQAQMMDFLEERYHEKFVMKGYIDCLGNWYGNYVEMKACPEGKDDGEHLFIVEGKPDDAGNLEYKDSYLYILIEKDYLKYFEQVINEYFDNCHCEVDFYPEYNTVSPKIPGNATVEELLGFKAGRDYYKPLLCIYSEQKLKPEVQGAFFRELQNKKFQGRVDMCVTDRNGEILEVNRYDIGRDEVQKDLKSEDKELWD